MWEKQVSDFCNTPQKLWLNEMIIFNENDLNSRSVVQDLKPEPSQVRVRCYCDVERC
jgi:hypothetical protein